MPEAKRKAASPRKTKKTSASPKTKKAVTPKKKAPSSKKTKKSAPSGKTKATAVPKKRAAPSKKTKKSTPSRRSKKTATPKKKTASSKRTKKSAASRSSKKAASRPTRKKKLGWREWVAFPEWGIHGVRSKVDTGARTSALHATDLEELELDGVPSVRFLIQCEKHPKRPPTEVTIPVADKRQVRDSGGREEVRPVVVAEVEVRGYRERIEVTLTQRDDMEFNMLLGRRGIAGRFFVDPELSYVGGNPPPSRARKARSRPSKAAKTHSRKSAAAARSKAGLETKSPKRKRATKPKASGRSKS